MGILTAVYLAEYAPSGSRMARMLRWLVQVLAGVPSVIFGLFGLGFFVGVVGGGLDRWTGDLASPVWGRPALLWASLTMALMTLPVVVVATEEALRSVPRDLRVAAIALGATRLQVLLRILLPNALPGIATGVILAIGRASGEVVPLLFTGAAIATQGSLALNERFMDLAYQVFVLSTQSPDPLATRPLLLASVWALVFLSLLLNAGAAILRSRATPAARDPL
jgi:phosphate transport system permease protein